MAFMLGFTLEFILKVSFLQANNNQLRKGFTHLTIMKPPEKTPLTNVHRIFFEILGALEVFLNCVFL